MIKSIQFDINIIFIVLFFVKQAKANVG